MPLIRCDSWDHYSQIDSKWDTAGTDCNINLTGTKSRTGIGCLIIRSAAFGPKANVTPTQKLLVGTAYYSNAVEDQNVIWIGDTATSPFNQVAVRVWVTTLGALRVTTGNDPFTRTVVESVPGLYHFNTYNYIEVKAFGDNGGAQGTVEVHCNGALACRATGISWVFGVGSSAFGFVQLMAAGGIPDTRHDDTYIIDWTSPAPNGDFLGPVQLYAGVPVADVSVTWTPLSGADNFAMVDEIPPDGDTSYNSSDTPGDTDQYEHPLTGVPANSRVFAVQHCLDLRVDSGSRTLGSVVYGVDVGDPVTIAAASSYLIYHFPMDLNPQTAAEWEVTDFPVNAGPTVVS
jgi:hypothetical protein